MTKIATKPQPAKINGAIAAKIVRLVKARDDAKAELEKAQADLTDLVKYAGLVPPKVGAVGAGHTIKHWLGGGGATFSLKDYRDAGHPVTKEMEPFIGERSQFHQWHVKPIPGSGS